MEGTTVLGRLSWQVAEVVDIVAETPRVKTIAFDVRGWHGHRAGQHVDVRLTVADGYQAQRSYSIASPPDGTSVELTVERLDDGAVSPYLTDELRPGDQIELRGPVGGYFVWEPSHGGPLLLVAGGSGVAPLMALLRLRAGAGSNADARLLFSSRSWEDVIYRDELERLEGDGLRIVQRSRGRSPTVGRATRAGSTPTCSPRSAHARPSGRASTSAARLCSSRPSPRRSYSWGTTRRRSGRNASDRQEGEMDALMLDGNAIAGMLQEVFAVEMTMAMGTCGNCGATEPMGATHVFKGAGVVMRCPHCDTVLAKIVRSDVRGIVEALGHRRAKLCDQAADDVVPVDDRHPPVGLREDEPEDVPVLHRDCLEIVEEAGRKVVRPTTNRFWIPDGFFGGPGNALNLTAVGQGVAVGEHLFVNTYLLGVTICAAAGQSTFALGLRAH